MNSGFVPFLTANLPDASCKSATPPDSSIPFPDRPLFITMLREREWAISRAYEILVANLLERKDVNQRFHG